MHRILRSILLAAALVALPFVPLHPAEATVSTTTSRSDFTGNGTTTVFSFTWPALASTWVQVQLAGVTQSSGYTVALNANQTTNPGGSVTFTAAPGNGVSVRLQRVAPLTQATALSAYSAFPAKTIEQNLDRVTMAQQQLDRDRADVAASVTTEQAARASGDAAITSWAADQIAMARGQNPYQATSDSSTVLSSGSTTSRTLAARFSDQVNVLDFGADPTGATESTTAIQAALNTGKNVFVPAGTYVVSNVQPVSNQRIFGVGWTSILKQKAGAAYVVSINPGTGGTSDPASNVRNVTFSDLAFLGRIVSDGWSEFSYLLNLNAVSDIVVERCSFTGWQGDGIYLGSSNVAATERHNERVVIRDSYFDGVNALSRNAISVIDGTDVLISRNSFISTTRPNYPGAIDLEPNADAFARLRRITIEKNRIEGGGGAGIALLLLPNTFVTTPLGPFRIRDNFISGKPTGLSFSGDQTASAAPAASVPAYDVIWESNTVVGGGLSGASPFILNGLKGAVLRGNVFGDFDSYGQLGYTTGLRDVLFEGNTFARLGGTTTDGVWARWLDTVQFVNNRWIDNGLVTPSAGRALNFVAGTSYRVTWRQNTVQSPTGRTTVAVGVNGGTIDAATAEDTDNVLDPALNHYFAGRYSRLTAAPTSGTWALGQFVWNATPGSTGVLGWLCTSAGTPGTWVTARTGPRALFANYQATQDFDAATYDVFSFLVQAGLAITYNAPTGGIAGQRLTIRVKNQSGGAMGTITWNGAFKLGGTFTNPATGYSRTIEFLYDGSVWVEVSRADADVPN